MRQGDGLALRFDPEIAPFAAVVNETAPAFHALAQLVPAQAQVALLSLGALTPESSFRTEHVGLIRQMVDGREAPAVRTDDILRLGDSDAPEMLALAKKTQPGPFASRTHRMGNYLGIREHGRLIAMAGERMHPDGYVEISAVCVDDDYRGQGLAGRLMNVLRHEIRQRGDTPFLHVFDHNHAAVTLYERLGFETRQTFHLHRLTREATNT